ILLSNLGERWIRTGIGDRFRVLTEKLLPFCRGILLSEKYRRDHPLDQCKVTEDPERVTPAIWCRKRRCSVAHLVDYAQHRSIRNGQRELNSVFRVHFLSSWNCTLIPY